MVLVQADIRCQSIVRVRILPMLMPQTSGVVSEQDIKMIANHADRTRAKAQFHKKLSANGKLTVPSAMDRVTKPATNAPSYPMRVAST